ncbi:hypothetical protein [Streptomyces showdoensis]|uniref:hypothetical protein n=1 Tax=Streptomyces showdoensis TaxID=68268 RepID=UPI000F5037FC|nr:hypothetical protein [Streptomyces showdoensis]
MTDIVFNPTFKHVAWVDNRDRVAASGQNGFNVRFDSIQRDLEALSSVVRQVDVGLKAAGQRPTVERKLTLAPAFTPLSPAKAWVLDRNGVAARTSSLDASAQGLLAVTPPDGGRLGKLRATGVNSGNASLTIALYRAPLADAANREVLAQLDCTGAFGDARDVAQDKNRVDMSVYRYFITAALSSATDSDTIFVSSVQLSYFTE